MRIDKCLDVRIDMCLDVRIDMCLDVRIDMCVDTRAVIELCRLEEQVPVTEEWQQQLGQRRPPL